MGPRCKVFNFELVAVTGLVVHRLVVKLLAVALDINDDAIALGYKATKNYHGHTHYYAIGQSACSQDGAVARATQKTDFGGYLDISADFLFYGAIPMAFVWLDPAMNGAAGAFLLTAFYFNGSTFLGYAILAEKKKLQTAAQGVKSLYYSNGILEGAETIGFFVLLCLFPQSFAWLAWVFGSLCFATGASRLYAARQIFTD